MPPLRVAVIGAGAFGRNHLRVYRELEQAHPDLVQLSALVEPDEARRNAFAATYNIPAFATVEQLLGAPSPAPSLPKGPASGISANLGAPCPSHLGTWVDAASICVPTIHHAAVAEQLLLANIDVLIEKPFAATLAEADHLSTCARERARILAVGHLERFNPAVTATIGALNRPMFFESHRLSVFTPRSLDVDVVLDLMIHDLDIVLSLTQSPVKEVRAVGLPILSPKTDIANVRVEFDSGCVANFTASRVSTEQVRKLRLFQPHQYLSLDFAHQELLTISVDPTLIAAAISATQNLSSRPDAAHFAASLPQNLSSRPEAASLAASLSPNLSSRPEPSQSHREGVAERPAAPPTAPTRPDGFRHEISSAAPIPARHPTPGLNLIKADISRAEPLRLELEDFLHAVRNRTQPRVPAEAGRAALSLALTINEQIAAHAHQAGLL